MNNTLQGHQICSNPGNLLHNQFFYFFYQGSAILPRGNCRERRHHTDNTAQNTCKSESYLKLEITSNS